MRSVFLLSRKFSTACFFTYLLDFKLRKIDRYTDFSFIPIKVRPYLEDNGRSSWDPRLSSEGKWIYRMRKEKVERNCRLRGKEKVKEQALMTAACRNMKKIAPHLSRVSWVEERLFLS